MNAAVCTLFEKNYHYGLGGLANSLFHHGFRGVIWAGYRGPLPPWASPVQDAGAFQEYRVTDGFAVRFVPLGTQLHFTNYKPDFILEIFERYDPLLQTLFYFDPDIVINCRWSFYEEWADFGIALVQDITNSDMPSNHPVRMQWKRFLEQEGFSITREVSQYFNAGFIGLRRESLDSVRTWKTLQESMGAKVGLMGFMPGGDRSSPFFAPDQDSLNVMTMCTEAPLSTIGPEGMDLVPGGFTMSHAVGAPKPWSKQMLRSALKGVGPSLADRAYWRYADQPIAMFSPARLRMQRMDNVLGAAVGRLIRRR
jgi:hypothetical protein